MKEAEKAANAETKVKEQKTEAAAAKKVDEETTAKAKEEADDKTPTEAEPAKEAAAEKLCASPHSDLRGRRPRRRIGLAHLALVYPRWEHAGAGSA